MSRILILLLLPCLSEAQISTKANMQMIFDSLAGIVKTIMIEQKIKIRDIPFDENKLAFEVDTTLQLFSAYFTPGKRYEFNHDSSIRKCEQPE